MRSLCVRISGTIDQSRRVQRVRLPIIETTRLTKRYGRRGGIEAVDLSVSEGQICGFLGPNGSGKTTAIRVLVGLLRPGSGVARVFGLDCWRQSPQVKRHVGYLPGDLRLYSWMTGRDAVAIFGRIRGRDLALPAAALAERFALPMQQRVRTMSRGTRQKLGLVLALAHEPRLMILDEPTTGLDPPMRSALAAYLRERSAVGDTVFFSSHTLGEVEQLCDRVSILRSGRVVADESLETLRNRAKRTVTIEFRSAAAAQEVAAPPFLAVVQRNGANWQCQLVGAAPPLIQWAGQQPLADLSLGKPDLETLFHAFYETPETER